MLKQLICCCEFSRRQLKVKPFINLSVILNNIFITFEFPNPFLLMNDLSLVFLQQFLHVRVLFVPAVAYSALLIFFKENFIVSLFAVVNWKRGGTEKKIRFKMRSTCQIVFGVSNVLYGYQWSFFPRQTSIYYRKMLHFQFINRKRRKIAHENQLSDQFSKSTVIDARLQNAMGLLSLLIALSLQLKWVKIGNNYHFLTEKKKPLLRLKWQVFKMM